jgi:hypothetical protein
VVRPVGGGPFFGVVGAPTAPAALYIINTM